MYSVMSKIVAKTAKPFRTFLVLPVLCVMPVISGNLGERGSLRRTSETDEAEKV